MTQAQPSRLKLSVDENNSWTFYPEIGTPFETLLEPGFWAHVSAKFKPYDEIRVIAEDGDYYARLLVLDAGKLYAKVKKLEFHDLGKVEVMQTGPVLEGHFVKWRGPLHKWCVLRGNDVLKDSMTKEEAHAWLGQYSKSVAA